MTATPTITATPPPESGAEPERARATLFNPWVLQTRWDQPAPPPIIAN